MLLLLEISLHLHDAQDQGYQFHWKSNGCTMPGCINWICSFQKKNKITKINGLFLIWIMLCENIRLKKRRMRKIPTNLPRVQPFDLFLVIWLHFSHNKANISAMSHYITTIRTVMLLREILLNMFIFNKKRNESI